MVGGGRQSRWTRIALYYLIAIAFSALARLYWHSGEGTRTADGAGAMYFHLVAGVGPALGAAAVWLLFLRRRAGGLPGGMTLGGGDWRLGLAMIAVPAIVMGVRGVANDFSVEPHLFGLHLGVWIALYAVLEECGWRGYMQGELRDWPALARYALVGLFWYAWHLSWVNGNPIASEAISLIFLIGASIGIGFVADRTGSVLAASAFHILGNIMGTTTDFRRIIPDGHDRLILCLTCLIPLLLILRLWRMRERKREG